jgi:hypothetical protein
MIGTPCDDIQIAPTPVHVHLPDGSTMSSSHTGTLRLPGLPLAARRAHIFPALTDHALLSVGLLCDHGCQVHFTETDVTVFHQRVPFIIGYRASNGLWKVDLAPKANNLANAATAVVPASSNLSDLLRYLHACCFSPTKSTWIRAIRNGHFTTWPGVTVANVSKLLPDSVATALGHLDQKRKNFRTTKENNVIISTESEPFDTIPLEKGERSHHIYAALEEIPAQTGAIASDQTGRFPVTSSQGMKYLIVIYDYDSNAIFAEPLINRTAKEILRAYTKIHTLLVSRGLRPQLQRLDNEASTILKEFLKNQQIDFQLVPPGIHRRNAAERAIRTWKNHFIAGLCSTNPNFPIYLWDKLVEQATMTLNLLRQSRMNPQLSAYAQIFGSFDFNRTPLAPPGTKVVVHVKPDKRQSWAPHGNTGWYTGPAMEHYRCYQIYVTKTQSYRISDTVEFFPHQVPMPKLSSADAAQQAARDLIFALEHPTPAAPFHPLGEAQLTALRKLATIFEYTAPRVGPKLPETQPVAAKTTVVPAQNTPDTPLHVLLETPHPTPLGPDWYATAVTHPETGKSMEYRELISNPATKEIWTKSAANEFGRLAQGVGGRINGTNTIQFIQRSDVPKGKVPTYALSVPTRQNPTVHALRWEVI